MGRFWSHSGHYLALSPKRAHRRPLTGSQAARKWTTFGPWMRVLRARRRRPAHKWAICGPQKGARVIYAPGNDPGRSSGHFPAPYGSFSDQNRASFVRNVAAFGLHFLPVGTLRVPCLDGRHVCKERDGAGAGGDSPGRWAHGSPGTGGVRVTSRKKEPPGMPWKRSFPPRGNRRWRIARSHPGPWGAQYEWLTSGPKMHGCPVD